LESSEFTYTRGDSFDPGDEIRFVEIEHLEGVGAGFERDAVVDQRLNTVTLFPVGSDRIDALASSKDCDIVHVDGFVVGEILGKREREVLLLRAPPPR
jgi:hypothetical protein